MTQQAAPAEVAAEVKKGQALELRIAGANYREIARTLGISVSTAHEYVTAGLVELQNDNAERIETLRRIEKTRLEGVLVKLWPKRDQPRVADSIVRISESIRRLEGVDIGKGAEEPPPPPPSMLPAQINITLVAPDGSRLSGSAPIPSPNAESSPG